jgi:hypothetical protein
MSWRGRLLEVLILLVAGTVVVHFVQPILPSLILAVVFVTLIGWMLKCSQASK